MSSGFRVDTGELCVISERIHGAGDVLNERRNHLPPGPANAGISTEILSDALQRIIAGTSGQLDDLAELIGKLGHSRAWYETSDAQARGDILQTITGKNSPPGLYPTPIDPSRQIP
jgi:hypothetical protein